MKTPFQITKLRNVILYILQSFTSGVDYIKLFKILYFAQKEHLVKYGRVIVEENFKAKRLGPVPSFTYKAIKIAENNEKVSDFVDFLCSIKVSDKKVSSSVSPDMDYISVAEKDSLDIVIARYRDIDSYALSEMSHDTAWTAANERMKDDPQKDFISRIDMARAGGASDEMVNYIRDRLIFKEALS